MSGCENKRASRVMVRGVELREDDLTAYWEQDYVVEVEGRQPVRVLFGGGEGPEELVFAGSGFPREASPTYRLEGRYLQLDADVFERATGLLRADASRPASIADPCP